MRENDDRRLIELFSKSMAFADAFECLFENASDAVYILDKHGKFVTVNRKAEEITGFKREDFIGKSFRKVISTKSLPKALRGFLSVIRGKPVRLELGLKTATKKTLLVEVTSTPFTIDGRVVGALGIVRDMTERVLMEKRLEETNNKLKTLFETAMEGITIVDAKDNLTFVNKAFADMLGYKEDELLGVNLRKLVDRRGFEEIRRQTETRKSGKISRYELVMYRRDGKPRIVQVSASPMWDEKRTFAGAMAIVMDITERRRTEETLRENEEKFRNIFESANDGMIFLDRYGRILDVNRKAVQVFGGSKKELLGKHFTKVGVFSLREIPTIMRAFANILVCKTATLETCIKNKKGLEICLECSSSLMKINDKIFGILVVARDITERKQMQKKLNEYSQQLEELVEKRTRQLKEAQEKLIKSERLAAIGEVAAMVGHDLRNPLTGIAGAVYYLRKKSDSKMDKTTQEILKLIEESIEYSSNIIRDLLEFSKEIKLVLTETTPKSIMKGALSLVKVPSNIQVLYEARNEPKIRVDVEKAKRVFANIIKNAIDAMPKGGKLTITSREKDGKLEVAFEDTGIGISRDILGKIWTPFFTTKAKGMGLGLPICKRIVEAHGGNVSVESSVGKGTKFTVTFPIKPKTKEEKGGIKTWVHMPESLLSTTTKA